MQAKKIIGDYPFYWINLDRCQDRKERIEKLFDDNNITNHKRIKAIDGQEINFNEYKEKYNVSSTISVYELACCLSHIKAIETAYNDDQEYALITEDDCNFDYIKYQTIPINELIENVDPKWDIIQLSVIHNYKKLANYSNTDKLFINGSTNGAHCYLINRIGMLKVINFLKQQIEIQVSEQFILKNLNTYMTKPYFSYYYFYDNCKSHIRENTKAALSIQTKNKIHWDEYYTNLHK